MKEGDEVRKEGVEVRTEVVEKRVTSHFGDRLEGKKQFLCVFIVF